MFHRHVLDIKNDIKEVENIIRIEFFSKVKAANKTASMCNITESKVILFFIDLIIFYILNLGMPGVLPSFRI